MAMGCAPEVPANCHCLQTPTRKAEIEGVWSYSATRVERREDAWVDVETSTPVLVRGRVMEHYVEFETLVDPQVIQAFRVYGHATIENDVITGRCCSGPRVTYDGRPWQEHNGFRLGWTETQLPPPLVLEGALEVYPTFFGADPNFALDSVMHDAMHWRMPSAYEVRTCEGDEPACVTTITVRHSFTRVTSP